MDYKGQVINEWVHQFIMVLFGIIGFLLGWTADDFEITFKIWLAGLVLAGCVGIPDWGMFNRHPVSWIGIASTATGPLSSIALAEGTSDEDLKQRIRLAQRRKARK